MNAVGVLFQYMPINVMFSEPTRSGSSGQRSDEGRAFALEHSNQKSQSESDGRQERRWLRRVLRLIGTARTLLSTDVDVTGSG